jgi:hypothetical protein
VYIAGVMSAVIVIAVGIVFIMDKSPGAWRSMFGPDDLEVLAFANRNVTVISNIGAGAVLVRGIEVRSEKLLNKYFAINQIIKANELYVEQTSGRGWKMVTNRPVESWGALDESDCYDVAVWDSANPILAGGKKPLSDVVAVHGLATVKFRSLRDGKELAERFTTRSVLIQYDGCSDLESVE